MSDLITVSKDPAGRLVVQTNLTHNYQQTSPPHTSQYRARQVKENTSFTWNQKQIKKNTKIPLLCDSHFFRGWEGEGAV